MASHQAIATPNLIDYDAFREELKARSLAPLWEVLRSLVPDRPRPQAVPALWRYADLRPALIRAGELISAETAERRVLILENPALPGQSRITSMLYAGLQLILPGEVARCHRHSQSALRFVMEGDGAYTAVDGERLYMSRGDLILTPGRTWHDHGNETQEPMIWLDGLDIPLVAAFDTGFAEHPSSGELRQFEARPSGDTLARYGSNLRPARSADLRAFEYGSLLKFPFSQWREALETLRRAERWDEHDGLRMEFASPRDGGSMMSTISAFCQLIPKGMTTRPLKSTDGLIVVVVEGRGKAILDRKEFSLNVGDVLAAPSWSERNFVAEDDLVLFSYSDRAAQQRLDLWREELL